MRRNPVLQPEYCFADGEPHVVNGELFVYPSTDERPDEFSTGSYFVPHTKDLENWVIDGPVFEEKQVHWSGDSKVLSSLNHVKSFDDLPAHIKNLLPPEAKEIPIEQIVSAIKAQSQAGLSKNRCLYAPDGLTKDGKSYLYFGLSDNSEGVAFADRPEGPFRDPVRITVDKTGEPITGIDPAVFCDDDGKCYLYWGQFRANGAQLTDDMCHVIADTMVEGIVTEEQHYFHEGSSMRKRGDTYYFVFADVSRGKPNCLGYATSKSPLGPFTYRGVIIDNTGCDPCVWNNHGGMELINGQWYIFYHRSSCNSQYMRRMCAEPIFFDEDGLIPEVPMTSVGMGKPYSLGETIHAYEACQVSGTAYISHDKLVVKKGKADALFRYVDIACGKPKEVHWSGIGMGDVELHCDESGELRLEITAYTDMEFIDFTIN